MDVIALEGIWSSFPAMAAIAGHGSRGYGMYYYFAEQPLQKVTYPLKTKRAGLVDRMMARLEEEETVHLALFLAGI